MKLYYTIFESDETPLELSFVFEEDGVTYTVSKFSGSLFKVDGGFVINGKMEVSWQEPCCRCLNSATGQLNIDVNAVIEPNLLPGSSTGETEHEILDHEGDIYYTDPDYMDLHDILRQEVLLAKPVKTVCSPECSCQEIDDSSEGQTQKPFSGLADLKNKFKEK